MDSLGALPRFDSFNPPPAEEFSGFSWSKNVKKSFDLPPLKSFGNNPPPRTSFDRLGDSLLEYTKRKKDAPVDHDPFALKLDPVNPLSDPGKWFHRYITQLEDPILEAWHSDSWKIPKTAVAVLGSALSIIPAAVTTTMGFKNAPSLYEAGEQYARANHWSKGAEWALKLPGLAADMVLGGPTDPLRFVTFGARPLAKMAEKILHEAPMIPGITDPAKIATLKSGVRMGQELTEENVRHVVVPEMMRRNMKGVPWEAKTPIPEFSSVQPVFGDHDLFEHIFGSKKAAQISHPNPNMPKAPKSFEEMRLGFLQNEGPDSLKAYASPNWEHIQDPTKPLYEKIETLAGHSAYLEKEILDGVSKTRLHIPYGSPSQWMANAKKGLAIGPSPVKWAKKAVSGIFYKWEDTPEFRQAIKTYTPQDTIDKINNLVKARGHVDASFDAGIMTPIELEQTLRMIQHGTEAGSDSVLHDPASILRWMQNEAKIMPQQYRLSHMKNLHAFVDTMASVIERHPKNVFASRAFDVRKAANYIKDVIENAELQTGKGGVIEDLLYSKDPNILKTYQSRLDEMMSRARKMSKDIKQQIESASHDIGRAVATPGPQGVVDLIKSSLQLKGGAVQASQVSSKTGQVVEKFEDSLATKFTDMMELYKDLRDATTPYSVAVQNRMFNQDVMKTLDEINSAWVMTNETIRHHFNAQNMRNVDGVTVLSDLLNHEDSRQFLHALTEDPVGNHSFKSQKDIQKWMKTNPQVVANRGPMKGQVVVSARTTSDIASERKMVQDQMEAMLQSNVASARITAQDAQKVQKFMNGLSHEGFANMLYGLRDIAASRLHGSLEAALSERLISPMKDNIMELNSLLRTEFAAPYKNLTESLAKYQTIRNPRAFAKFLFEPGGWVERLEKLGEEVFRKKGLNYHAISAMEEVERKRASINESAEDHAIEWWKSTCLERAIAIDPTIKLKVGSDLEIELAESAYKYAAYLKTVRDIPADITLRRDARVYEIAQKKIDEGIAKLSQIFGNKNKALLFAEDAKNLAFAEMEREFENEGKIGMIGVHRDEYLPYTIKGSKADREELRKALFSDSQLQSIPLFDRNLISRVFGAEEHRTLRDAAGVEHYIEKLNAKRVAGGLRPLEVSVEDNMVASIADRKKRQLTALVNRDMIAKLQVYLPGNSFIRYFPPDQAKKIEMSTEWKSLRSIVPSMQDYFISKDLFSYLEQYVPQYQKPSEFYQFLSKYWSLSTRVQVQFSLVHLKNLAGLAFIAGVDPVRFYKIMRQSIGNQGKLLEAYPGAMNFMTRVSKSLEHSPLYKQAVRSGISHFRGAAQFNSVAENVKIAMKPQWGAGRIWDKGLASTLIFDVLDRACKMTLFEELIEQGAPAEMAAKWTNYFMIDYAARNLTPKAKAWGYATAPFFSWKIQNALLHVPNMIENPAKYVMMNYFRHYVPDKIFHSNPFIGMAMPAAIANTMPMPLHDKNGNQMYLSMDMPWDQYVNLFSRTVAANPYNPLAWRGDLWRFFLARTRFNQQFRGAFSPYELQKIRNETLWQSLFGDEKREGMVDQTLWGVLPILRKGGSMVQSALDPNAWKDFGPAFMDFATQMTLGELRPVSPYGTVIKR